MVSAINGDGFGCTARVQPDGTIARRRGVTLNTGTTLFSKVPEPAPERQAWTSRPSPSLTHHCAARPRRSSFSLRARFLQVRINNLENLDGTTFKITDAADKTTTFQFADAANSGPGGGRLGMWAMTSNGSTETRRATPSNAVAEIVDAINGYAVIANIDFSLRAGDQNLDGTTFQITDGLDNKATFEFIDAADDDF